MDNYEKLEKLRTELSDKKTPGQMNFSFRTDFVKATDQHGWFRRTATGFLVIIFATVIAFVIAHKSVENKAREAMLERREVKSVSNSSI